MKWPRGSKRGVVPGSLYLRPTLVDELDVMIALLRKLAHTLQDAGHCVLVDVAVMALDDITHRSGLLGEAIDRGQHILHLVTSHSRRGFPPFCLHDRDRVREPPGIRRVRPLLLGLHAPQRCRRREGHLLVAPARC